VGRLRLKTEVTNQLHEMLRSHMHKEAEHTTAVWINSDKLTGTNSKCFHRHFAAGTSNNLLTVVKFSSTPHWNARQINLPISATVSWHRNESFTTTTWLKLM